ncbi:MAG TPA: J domain-containing protein, partial [Candidatus Rifleibacterium sp.]|nr:J domain-containing protein [Candidatus Rifleibacterium sp.]
GAWNLLHHQEEYRRCLAIMGLPEGVSLDLLRKRFRHLARTLHPDINPVDHAEFARINSAYRTLLKLLNV